MREKNVPKLRFNGFSDEWEEKRLGKLLEFKNGINADKDAYGKGVKFINVLDILNNNFITASKILGKVKIDKNTLENYSVNYGDVLFQRSSETREEVGSANVYLDYETVTFGGFVIRGKKVGEYNPLFMNGLLKSSSARKEITTKAGGSTRYNVGQETLSEVTLKFPTIKEQEKIANFLNKVDKIIEKQEEKVSSLEKYKKGMMQKIFSQEIRFKRDDDREYPEWEEKRLGELCKITTGKLDANAMEENGIYRFYTCAKEVYKINKFAFDTEALLISGNGANVGYIHYYKGKFNAYQRTYVLDNFINSIQYIKYYLEKNLYKRIIKEKKEGNTPYIVLNTLTEMLIELPSFEEQNKIAKVLSNIDSVVEKEKEKLEELRVWKKGLLQQMFV